MAQIKKLTYTKDAGDVSYRNVIVVSSPRKNFLVYDVSNLSEKQLDILQQSLNQIEEYRVNCMKDFELVTGIKQSSLWRSFKPEGCEWNDNDEI